MNETQINNNFEFKKRIKYFIWSLFSLAIISIIFFIFLITNIDRDEKKLQKKDGVYAHLDIKAKSFFVLDVANNAEIISKNKDLVLPLASLTKIMTVITANTELDKSEKIEIKQEYLDPEGDSSLAPGDFWKIEDLMDYTLITSSNDGAYALAQKTAEQKKYNLDNFVFKMNSIAKKIGMKNSHFYNVHGLDDTNKSGAYGSAKDVAMMLNYALKKYPKRMEATHYDNLALKSSASVYNAINTNTFVDKIPGILASKTGYTDLAGGNLVIAFDAGINRPIIIAVLGSTQEDRFLDTVKLTEATLKNIQK